MSAGPSGTLADALGVVPGDIVSLVGGGGKTTIMFALAWELAAAGVRVVATTTTKMYEPPESQAGEVQISEDEGALIRAAARRRSWETPLTLGRRVMPDGKLAGLTSETVAALADVLATGCVIVEADGARHRPIKAPQEGEPVVPEVTTLFVPVVGSDAVGARLEGDEVFRPERVAAVLQRAVEGPLSADDVAALVVADAGLMKGAPPTARVVAVINKVDLPGGLAAARRVAARVLLGGRGRIRRVVLAAAGSTQRVAEVLCAQAAPGVVA